jgi:hypothetical protein
VIGPGNIDIEISSPIFFWEGGKGGGFLTTLYKKKKKEKGFKKNAYMATEHKCFQKENKRVEGMYT